MERQPVTENKEKEGEKRKQLTHATQGMATRIENDVASVNDSNTELREPGCQWLRVEGSSRAVESAPGFCIQTWISKATPAVERFGSFSSI